MIGRIKHVIEYSQLSSSAFADTIGISHSGLTHLLTGRNQPSLDVARKILAKFPEISTEWLIMGMGDMLRPDEQPAISSDSVMVATTEEAYPAENSKIDRQTNLFGEFENPMDSETDMQDYIEIAAEQDNKVLQTESKNIEENVETAAESHPSVVESLVEVPQQAQPQVRKAQDSRQVTPSKRDRRQTNTAPEKKLQKIIFFYDDHSFEVFS